MSKWLLLLVVMCVASCGEKTVFDILDNAEIEIRRDNEPITDQDEILIGNVDVGQEVIGATLVITNKGTSDLTIDGFTLVSNPPGALVATAPTGSEMPSEQAPWVIAPYGSGASNTSLSVNIMLTRTDAAAEISGSLTVTSNSALNQATSLEYDLKVVDLKPLLDPLPESLDFENVFKGEAKTLQVTLLNPGTDTLTITGFKLAAPEAYEVLIGDKTYPAGEEAVTFETPVTIPKGNNASWKVTFKPDTPDPMPGTLWILSNAADTPETGTEIPLKGNMTGACFTLNPKSVDFGGYPLDQTKTISVEVSSCGTEALKLTNIAFDSGDIFSDMFSVDATKLPGVSGAIVPTAENPAVLEPGEKGSFEVSYKPTEAQGFNVNGDPILDVGLLRFTTNTFVPERELPLSGHGLEEVCPTAVIQVQPGELVIPQTELKLFGESSYAGFGQIVDYEWSVVQPDGSSSQFLPSNTVPNPSFVANVAGIYTFNLRVWDDLGNESCVPGQMTVEVKPDEVIHVEVLWTNPDDESLDPNNGSDLDLHFLHPFAKQNKPDYDEDGEPDGWFDAIHDCFWYNREPNWDVKTTDEDDPGLDLDDKNGGGPENVNLHTPPPGATYYVGVHYWKENGHGAATATVRVYLLGELVYETTQEGLVKGDLWEVCKISFDEAGEGTVTSILGPDETPKVFANYPTPPQLPTD